MSLQLTTVLEPRGPAGAIVLTDAQLADLGASKRSPVTITVGDRSVEARIGVMAGELLVGLSKAARTALGVEIGQTIDATLSVDEAPREVALPPELAAALAANPAARTAYDALAYSHRKEHATWVAEAKQQETRERRATQAVEKILGA
jgi:phosphoribosylformylglycinamidine (FGAM) synthase-like enzyme